MTRQAVDAEAVSRGLRLPICELTLANYKDMRDWKSLRGLVDGKFVRCPCGRLLGAPGQ